MCTMSSLVLAQDVLIEVLMFSQTKPSARIANRHCSEGERIRRVVSKVVAASVVVNGRVHRVHHLERPVVLSFQHSAASLDGLANPECVSWQFDKEQVSCPPF